MFYTSTYLSPVGLITLGSTQHALVGLWIEGEKYVDKIWLASATANDNVPIIKQTKQWLDAYFAGRNLPVDKLALQPSGSAFRQAVWQILLTIPYGELITYGDIAKRIAKQTHQTTMSSQAVGGAVGHNPISIIIPCHRVVGKHGNLTGYAGGIDKKIQLLKQEGINTDILFIPKKGTAL